MATAHTKLEPFSSGKLRLSLHLRCFHWLANYIRRAGYKRVSVVELGCSDGRVIDTLEATGVEVAQFQGFDANWHESIDFAREKYAARPELSFTICKSPGEMQIKSQGQIGVCLETFEHALPEYVEGYLAKFRQAVTDLMFITVPVERGPIFVAKHVAKRMLGINDEEFPTMWSREFWNQALGRMDRVSRHEHCGFDDRDFVRAVTRHFEIISAKGLFISDLPMLGPSLGIVCRPRGMSH